MAPVLLEDRILVPDRMLPVSLCIRAPPVAVSERMPLIPPPAVSMAAIPVSAVVALLPCIVPDSVPLVRAVPVSLLPLFPPQAAKATVVREPKSHGVNFIHSPRGSPRIDPAPKRLERR